MSDNDAKNAKDALTEQKLVCLMNQPVRIIPTITIPGIGTFTDVATQTLEMEHYPTKSGRHFSMLSDSKQTEATKERYRKALYLVMTKGCDWSDAWTATDPATATTNQTTAAAAKQNIADK